MNLPGGIEWVIIMVVALLIFGKRLPEIMRGMGSSVREFKRGMETGPEESHQQPAHVAPAVSGIQTVPRQSSPPFVPTVSSTAVESAAPSVEPGPSPAVPNERLDNLN